MRTAIILFLTLASFRALANELPARASRTGIVASEVHQAPIVDGSSFKDEAPKGASRAAAGEKCPAGWVETGGVCLP